MENFDETTLKKLQNLISPSRYAHSLRVAAVAGELARIYGAPIKKAKLAGLLHDCGKSTSNNILLNRVLEFGIVMDEVELIQVGLTHGQVSARLAMRDFGVQDEDILAAICYHTTGREGMSLLEKIVYLADYLEPQRNFPGLDELRELAKENLTAALVQAMDLTLIHIIERGLVIHPRTVAARNWALIERQAGR
ncbi:MAG: HD domain-containing protein [Firmicutes bacterium]|nr:HD domain-containing protein [Bacillota bacterium]